MSEEGVNIINGTNPPLRSRSPSPTRSDGKEQRKDGEEEKEEDLALQEPVKDLNPDLHATPEP